ncbi:MAG: 8-amino-7-oxononanoate synthase, partial [Planctomycetota bacterium]
PVFAIQAGDAEETRAWERALAERGFLVPHVHYPGGPPAGYLRLSASALHETADLDALLEVIAELVDPDSRKNG